MPRRPPVKRRRCGCRSHGLALTGRWHGSGAWSRRWALIVQTFWQVVRGAKLRGARKQSPTLFSYLLFLPKVKTNGADPVFFLNHAQFEFPRRGRIDALKGQVMGLMVMLRQVRPVESIGDGF